MQYEIAKKQLKCTHCGNTDFKRGKAQLNTALLTFFDMEFLNDTADTFLCTNCGKIEWFLPGAVKNESNYVTSEKETTWVNNISEESDCLSCGETIPPGSSNCPSCGWSYNS